MTGRISQRETAWQAGLSIDRYWRIEGGWAEATPDEKKRIARVLHVAVAHVLWRVRRDEVLAR